MADDVSIESELLLRLSIENLRDCRDDLRSLRSFAAASFAIPTALLFSDAGRSVLGIVLSIISFVLGLLVLMPSRLRMITSPEKVKSDLDNGRYENADSALKGIALDNIQQIEEARRMIAGKRLLWLAESIAIAGALTTYIVSKI